MSVARTPRAVLAIVSALALLLAVGGAVRLVVRERSPLTAANVGAADAADAQPAGTPPYTVAGGRPLALVVGDSYAEGYAGVTRPGGGLARQFASRMGWTLDLDAEGGTGYVAVGPTEQFPGRTSYPVRVAGHDPRERVSYVVVTGGLNDSGATGPVLRAAVDKTLTEAQAQWPTATVVVVGPMWVTAKPAASLLRVRDVVQQSAAEHGVAFVDPLAGNWVTVGNQDAVSWTDRVHPSQVGHDYFAERLAQAFAALKIPAGGTVTRQSWFPPAAAG